MFSSTLHILDFTSALGTHDVVLVMIITTASLLCRSIGVEMSVSGAVMVSVRHLTATNTTLQVILALLFIQIFVAGIFVTSGSSPLAVVCRKYMQIHMNTVYE